MQLCSSDDLKKNSSLIIIKYIIIVIMSSILTISLHVCKCVHAVYNVTNIA